MNKFLAILVVTIAICTASKLYGQEMGTDTVAMVQNDSIAATDTTLFVDDIEEEIPTLLAAWAPVLVDHSIGIRGGWGTGFMRREPARDNLSLPYDLWNFGISYRFDIPAQKYVGTIMFELQYVQKGFAYLEFFDGTLAYSRQYNVIELPILWQPYVPLGKKGSRVYLNAGPFISYTLDSYETVYDSETGEIFNENDYEMDQSEDYFWNYGIAAGVGFHIAIGRWAIAIDGRYTIQLSDILRGPEFIPGNPFRTPVDHIGASFGVQYKFSIGGKKKKNKDEK